jgi:hypothetical protein
MTEMQLEVLDALFKRIVREVKANTEPTLCWQRVLDIAGQSSNPVLTALDLPGDAKATTKQVRSIFAKNPLPSDVTFLYFGLYDPADDKGECLSAGFYLAGGAATSPPEALDRGDLTYFPENRFLSSTVLNRIKEAGCERPELQQLLDHAVVFGAAAILAKNIVHRLGLHVPVYVGFDSGDYSLVVG